MTCISSFERIVQCVLAGLRLCMHMMRIFYVATAILVCMQHLEWKESIGMQATYKLQIRHAKAVLQPSPVWWYIVRLPAFACQNIRALQRSSTGNR